MGHLAVRKLAACVGVCGAGGSQHAVVVALRAAMCRGCVPMVIDSMEVTALGTMAALPVKEAQCRQMFSPPVERKG